MAKFQFEMDGEYDRSRDPVDEELQGTAKLPDEIKGPKPNGKGITMTVFGREINGVPEVEINRIHREARQRLNEIEIEDWKDLGRKCLRIAAIDKPRQRAITAQTLFMGMHDGDPVDLEDFADATGNSVIDAADELSTVGGFEDKPYGIVTGEIRFDESDLPEIPNDDDDDGGDESLEIASVEA